MITADNSKLIVFFDNFDNWLSFFTQKHIYSKVQKIYTFSVLIVVYWNVCKTKLIDI